MAYALQILWFEKRRYMAGVLAVAFSAVLIAVQGGVLLGLVATVSKPVDISPAEVWLAARHTPSADNGGPLDRQLRNRLMMHPDVLDTDEYVEEYSRWWNPKAGTVLIIVCGMNLSEHSLGPVSMLTPELRVALSEPGTVAIDRADAYKLGVTKIGDDGQVHGQRVRVVGFLDNMSSMTGCYVVCSAPTARRLILYKDHQSTYFLARLKDPSRLQPVLNDLRQNPEFDALSKSEFSYQSRWYWILQTKSGLAVGFTALLGLLVGAVVTSQTLYAATATMLRELAVLRSLGVPTWRMNLLVVEQAGIIGIVGLIIGLPLSISFETIGNFIGTTIDVAGWLLAITAVIIIVMAVLSGVLALRSLSRVDPAQLLR